MNEEEKKIIETTNFLNIIGVDEYYKKIFDFFYNIFTELFE